MRLRLVFCVTLGVVAAHWLLMFGPLSLTSMAIATPPHAPEHLQAVWIEPPVVIPPAPQATPKPPAAPPVKKAIAPRPAPTRAAAPPEPVATPAVAVQTPALSPSSLATDETVAPDTAEPGIAPALPAPIVTLAAPAGPSLQVHDAANAAIAIHVPSDGSALAQQMALRFKVEGVVKGMQYHAHAELEWHTDGQTYHARQSISAFLLGSLEQTSAGLITPQGLQPLEFADRRLAKQRRVQLDWAAQQALFTPERTPAPIGPGTQDRLSVFLQLATMLQAMPALRTPGTRINIPTLGARRMQTWSFGVQEEVPLELPSGTITTLRLQRLPQPGDEETTQLWLHPALGYVPVRIRMEERNGDVMDLMLKP